MTITYKYSEKFGHKGKMRVTSLTPEIVKQVEGYIETVMYMETVSDLVGISRICFRGWIKRGRKEEQRLLLNGGEPLEDEKIFLELLNVVNFGIANAKAKALAKIASNTQWQASAWLLERRDPQQWGTLAPELREMQKRCAYLEKMLEAKTGQPIAPQVVGPVDDDDDSDDDDADGEKEQSLAPLPPVATMTATERKLLERVATLERQLSSQQADKPNVVG